MGIKPPYSERMAYRIGRGEEGVLTIQPYKGDLLPYWRFKTVPIAQESSKILWDKFIEYYEDDNFPGMDMARKFIQMGMTRAKRYANYKGGKKYVHGKAAGVKNKKSEAHEGKEEKEKASLVFREVWETCKKHEGYQQLRENFKKDQREWERMSEVERMKIKDEEAIKAKDDDGLEPNVEIKTEISEGGDEDSSFKPEDE